MSDELSRLVDFLVERVADAVARKLKHVGRDEYVDQDRSQLGRRRHINAIRNGELPGRQVGRQYLARQTDLDAFIAQLKPGPSATMRVPDDATDELAAELGFARQDDD
jgi:hypothetical protein